MSSATYTLKVNVRGNDEVVSGGEYILTAPAEKTIKEIRADWETCKDDLTAEGGMWESPEEIIEAMRKLGYEIEEANGWHEINLEA